MGGPSEASREKTGQFNPTSENMKTFIFAICMLGISCAYGQANSLDTKTAITQEDYDTFFNLVDNFFWDSADEEGRMYRRGFMQMRRPQVLMRRNGYQQEPSSSYRAFVDTCYDFACWSGLNSVINSFAKMG